MQCNNKKIKNRSKFWGIKTDICSNYSNSFNTKENQPHTQITQIKMSILNITPDDQFNNNYINLKTTLHTKSPNKNFLTNEYNRMRNKRLSLSRKIQKENNKTLPLISKKPLDLSKREHLQTERDLSSQKNKHKKHFDLRNINLVLKKAFNNESVALLRKKQLEDDNLKYELLTNPKPDFNINKYTDINREKEIMNMKRDIKVIKEINNFLSTSIFTFKTTGDKAFRQKSNKMKKGVNKKVKINNTAYIPVCQLFKMRLNEKMDE